MLVLVLGLVPELVPELVLALAGLEVVGLEPVLVLRVQAAKLVVSRFELPAPPSMCVVKSDLALLV